MAITDGLQSRELEEKLREVASIGDMEMLKNLVEFKFVDINSQNKMNGRSALHWGAKRNHQAVVQYLLLHGANPNAVDKDGKTAAQLTTNSDIHSLLGGSGDVEEAEHLNITPSYLAHPPFPYSDNSELQSSRYSDSRISHSYQAAMNNGNSVSSNDELVLKIRIAYMDDPDFIEVELTRTSLRYDSLINLMCAELGVDKQHVSRIRKLPNTIIRKDKDVARLTDFQELELLLTTKAASATSRGYRAISTNPNMTHEQILY